ncbi:hypothetical protein EJB05_55029 [Eragrostis curvula]|uniref:Uncharacterized protein n=1 Tax=Eragrostis curvula TaxID=38414 RepID=A0A5J9SKS8_9POAL|nr:hypothetical protein EJB05_55029 [Eragrostis curvula]
MDAALLQVDCSTAIKKNTPRFPMLLSVDQVLKWAFLAASLMVVVLLAGSVIFVAVIHIINSLQLTSTIVDADLVFFWDWNDGVGYLWLSVPMAAAAAVGLLLPRRRARGRWVLALVAIVFATVAHYMNGRGVPDFIAAHPDGIAYTILAGGGSLISLGADLLGIISLFIGGPEY